MVQTSDIMEITGSPVKLIGLFAAGVLMTAASAALAFRWIPSESTAWGWFGLLFFGLCTALGLWRLLTAGRTVLTISPHGIKDVRLSAEMVPWSGVEDISTAKIKRQKFVVIAVEPSIEERLALTRMARWSRGPNRLLGIDGLCISAVGLKINHDTLLKACLVHWQAARK
jgi:hypothetical protein